METPATLKELIKNPNHSGFKLAIGYYAELKHDSMGTFPAIESKSREVIITTDIELLKAVCETLPPRRHKISKQLVYVNLETGIAYSIFGTSPSSLEKAEPYRIFTQQRFDELSEDKKPFKWAPGLIGNDMSREEFLETLKAALKG